LASSCFAISLSWLRGQPVATLHGPTSSGDPNGDDGQFVTEADWIPGFTFPAAAGQRDLAGGCSSGAVFDMANQLASSVQKSRLLHNSLTPVAQ
jgi:hypothetical protein